MITTVIGILFISIFLYTLLGGADFGAGIAEFVSRISTDAETHKKEKQIIAHAIAPVWEANHMWLVLALVILLNAFPEAYSRISTTFHIPLLLMLFGIVIRGCAFSFRNYDTPVDQTHIWYGNLFVLASFLAPFMQGVIIAGCMLDNIPTSVTSFSAAYITPWIAPFCFALGSFTCVLSFFVASAFLIGETSNIVIRKHFEHRLDIAILLLILTGFVAWRAAISSGYQMLFDDALGIGALCVGALALVGLKVSVRRGSILSTRFWTGSFVAVLFIELGSSMFPFIIGGHPSASHSINLYDVAAPEATIRQLLLALVVGILMIFPLLGYLFWTMKDVHKTGSA